MLELQQSSLRPQAAERHDEVEGRQYLRDFVRSTTALRSHVLMCRPPGRALPELSAELRHFLGTPAPCYTGAQLRRAEGAPDELTPEDTEAFGLCGSAYDRCVSESLEWTRPATTDTAPPPA